MAFDTNGDGVFDANDAEFAKFGIWQDANSDGVTDEGEFVSLYEAGIASISLQSDGESYQAANGDVTVFGEGTLMGKGSQPRVVNINGREVEVDVVDRGGDLFARELSQVGLVDPTPHPVAARGPDPELDLGLDAHQLGQPLDQLVLVGQLDEEGGADLAGAGDQRVVDVELILDRSRLEQAFKAQHLLHLILHGHAILEMQHGMWPHRDETLLLVGNDPGAELRAQAGILFQAVELVVGKHLQTP